MLGIVSLKQNLRLNLVVYGSLVRVIRFAYGMIIGYQILILEDTHPCNTLAANTCEADLLDNPSSEGWNLDLVNKVFLPFDANEIFNIPLFLHWSVNKLVWGCT